MEDPAPETNILLDLGDALTLSEARLYLPRVQGGAPPIHAVRRWARQGARVSSGECIKLRTFHIGRLIYTRFRWIREFNQAYVRT